ncbi:MAG: hypothetical protein JXL97_06980 [Bacteroidales bacterium]|nr:hypothetical protein [Bacteroidales bacterium]
MKTHKNLFPQVCSFQNLLLAYKKAKRGTKQTYETNDYYFNLETKLLELQQKLITQTYQPAEYRYFEIHEPKKRTISVATFTDRIVHHAVVNVLEPIYEKIFIYHSYATRKNKGTHKAVFKAQEYLQKNVWFLKSDIQKYFDNINHEILIKIISRKISDKKLLQLIEKIIDNSKGHANSVTQQRSCSFNCTGIATSVAPVCSFSNIAEMSATKVAVPNSGLPIGNLTSQFFANVYLHELDNFVKNNLHQKFYIRYMDDFVIFSNNKQSLKDILPKIEDFLSENLSLNLKPKATIINQHTNGLSFLGTRIFRSVIRIKSENLKRISKKVNEKQYLFYNNKISEDDLISTYNSYNAFLDNYHVFSVKKDIFATKGI